MKKLYVTFVILFAAVLMSITVSAQTLNFDFNGDGTYDTEWTLDPPPPGGDTVQVKVWLDDWDTSPWALEPLFSIDFNFYIDNSKLQLNSVTHNTMSHGGPFENGLISFFDYGGGVYGIGVANFTCASITDKLLIATIELEGIAPGDSTISAKFDFPEGNVTPGGSACALPHAENGVDTTATIHQSECVVDQDCWNFMWCDGIETCAGGLCVAGVPPCSDDLDNCTNDCVEGTPSVESNPGTCNVCNATGISDLCCSDNACLGEPVCTVSIKDYYVDGDNGSNLNDGLTPATAWKTITWALSQDNGTENNQIIIHVAASTYDTVMGGGDAETFPLVMKSYVSLKGAGYIGTIINANQTETLDGGVIFAEQANNFTIDGFTITGGVALLKGGGIHLSYSSPSISNCKISGNTATYLNGGGIYLKQSSPEITNCLITGNTAPNQNGGGISCGDHSSPVVTNCTIADNTASNGFGEGGGGISCGNGSSPPVKNCILWGNYPDQILEQDGTAPTFNYCCIQGGHSGTGIVTSDPNFIGSGDYHIFLGSSCIDAADSSNAPVADIDGKDRYNDTTTPDSGTGPVTFYDIGAYEYLGDADYDGVKDDGDGSGIADDNPCTGGQTQNCDDNCILSPNGPDLGTCTAGSIGSICVSNAECGAGGFCSMQQEDSESDGVGDVCDNCLDTPNGPILGTCSKTIGGLTLSIQEICAVDNDCDVSGYFCLLNQSDVNGNGIGNACECYSDLNGDGDVNSADLLIMKIDYTRTDCDITPCQADINGDGNVNSADLLIMKIEYNRNNCQQLP